MLEAGAADTSFAVAESLALVSLVGQATGVATTPVLVKVSRHRVLVVSAPLRPSVVQVDSSGSSSAPIVLDGGSSSGRAGTCAPPSRLSGGSSGQSGSHSWIQLNVASEHAEPPEACRYR
jgi:hypothetical protein